jgi:hypothetical protein
MAGYIGNNPADTSVRIARQIYTTSGSQTDFTFAAGYDPGYIEVYVNGSRQTEGTNFTANDGNVFTILNGGVGAGVTVEAAAYKAFNLANVSLSEVTDVDDLTISGEITAATGDIGIATITASGIDAGVGIVTGVFSGDGSALTGVASTDNITTSTPAEFQQINVSGISTVGVLTVTTSAVVGNAVTMTSSALTVDQGVTATFSGDVNFQGGNYNIKRSRANSSIEWDDSATARFGTGNDLEVFSDGDNGVLKGLNGRIYQQSDTGLNFTKLGNAETFAIFTPDGSCDLYYDNTKRFETSGVGVTVTGICEATSFSGDSSVVTGIVTAKGGVKVPEDNITVAVGPSDELSLWHSDTSHSYIQNTTGTLYIRSKSDETAMSIVPDGKVDLRYDGSVKVETQTGGAAVTGILTATSLSGRHGNIEAVTKSTSYTLVSGDEGKMIITDSEVIVPENIFGAGDVFTVVNSSGSSINITKGTGINLYTIGSSTNATVALAEKGIAIITCFSGNDFIVGGGGVG